MAKKKGGRALAGLAALGTMGAIASRMSSPRGKRSALDEIEADVALKGPTPTGGRRAADILDEEYARNKPAVTDEEQARIFKGIPGVRTSTGIPVRSGDGLLETESFKKGGAVKSRGSVSSAAKRGDGIAIRGKTKGRML
jgi:hypothetical protein